MERIRLERLTKIYDRHPVVVDFNLSVATGDFCVILGPSGSGKSTVMNMIGGFTPPTSGEIYVDGKPTTSLAPHQRDLGMMFQGYALFPHLTVYENVAFPLRARGTADRQVRDHVERTLGLVELTGFEQRLPGELSGGQQQRTALARALVFGPRLLLMDEPLAALDRRLRERMQAEIRAIQRKLAITVIYITHDQQEAMTLADVLVVMNKGRAEQVGPPLDVYHRPRTRFVGEFLGDTNILDAAVESADGTVVVCRTAQGDTVVIEAGEPAAIGQPVTLAIRPEHVRFATNEAVECNQLVGEITEVVDWGVSRRYHVAIPGAERAVLVTEPGHPNVPARSLGDKAILAFDIGDVVLVAAST